ncbi:MAG TPA: histidine phosphatase family protein [Actinomycetota bacterium]|nr:histidine phosphatase family protein [Actinomycetota bacterium]
MSDQPGGALAPAVTLLVVRHGESEWNALGRWQGQANPHLSPRGRDQAVLAARFLSQERIDRVVCSDLERASRTGAIIAEMLGLPPPSIEQGLREIDVGEWSGLTRPEIELRWPNLLAQWSEGRLESTPGGETLSALRVRVAGAVNKLLATELSLNGARARTVLVISHRRAISALEESLGVRPVRAGHLAGRRFFADPSGKLFAGEPVDLLGSQT